MDNYFKSPDEDIKDNRVCEILFKFCRDKVMKNITGYPILYKEFRDSKGNRYGTENLTEYPFPIPKTSGKYSVRVIKTIKAYKGASSCKTDPHLIFYRHGIDRQCYPKFTSNVLKGRVFYTNHKGDGGCNLFNSYHDSINSDTITASYVFVHDNMNRIDVALFDNGYANEQDVQRYYKKENFNGGIRRKVNSLFERNSYKDVNLLWTTEKEKENSRILDLINNIESLLLTIKNINVDLYNKLNTKYQGVINNNDIKETDNEKELEEFYKELQSYMNVSNDADKTIEFLNNYINKLLDDVINKRFSNISIDYLTGLHDDILKNEESYSVRTIRDINIFLVFIY